MTMHLHCVVANKVQSAGASGASSSVSRLQAETEATSAAQQEASAQRHSLWQRLKSQLVG
jgi:hypothetical protein